ncbi:MAG: transglutaminase-like domain-containing protein [bacterium]
MTAARYVTKKLSISLILTGIILISLTQVSAAFHFELERSIQKDLLESRQVLRNIKSKLAGGKSIVLELDRLKTLVENIKVSHLFLKERFSARERKLEGLAGIGTGILDRQRSISDFYVTFLEEYLMGEEDILSGEFIQETTLESLEDMLDEALPQGKILIFGSLPYRHVNYQLHLPEESPVMKPAFMGGERAVSAGDLKDTPEAPLSHEIAALAQSLDWNPVLIYEWVKNNIMTEWYWGCMKGALETLRQRSGNDCDQATLLVALLRASGFPSRYVRGVIEFFPDMEKLKNLTGLEDSRNMAIFFQKAGIPCKPVIAGGEVRNLHIEHIWVESLIPMANFHGALLDEQGKVWLGLDTSIKVKGCSYTSPMDIMQEFSLSGIRDAYLRDIRSQTPLEFLKGSLQEYLEVNHSEKTYDDLLRTRVFLPEIMQILPASLQYHQMAVTHEYTQIPDELMHRVRFMAVEAGNRNLFDITLNTLSLSNQEIGLCVEPETAEDQRIINSYAGLESTPAYLVRLRPVLVVNGREVAVSSDGLPMGTAYTLTIELIPPDGAQRISHTNTHITGNYAVIGITSQKPVMRELAPDQGRDAWRLLYEEAVKYMERWNQAEDELASLMHLALIRPVPSVVTLGGFMEVTYLLNTPHGFERKGVYVDADVKIIESVECFSSSGRDERIREFMRFSSLHGSILENRIFEDDFNIESISTAKLFELAYAHQTPLLTIDALTEESIIPVLPFGDDIKDEIRNAVHQGCMVTIPQEEIPYVDWTGTGYLVESPETGESGWMLTGSIAGGLTAGGKDKWEKYASDVQPLLSPYLSAISSIANLPNTNPYEALYIYKVKATDYQEGKVGEKLTKPLAVKVFDKDYRPVAKAEVIFEIKAGGGRFSTWGTSDDWSFVTYTDSFGTASADLILGTQTKSNPVYFSSGGGNPQQVGENIVAAHLSAGPGASLQRPFIAYGLPKEPYALKKLHGDHKNDSVLTWTGFVSVRLEDEYENSLANHSLSFLIRKDKEWTGCKYLFTPFHPIEHAYLLDPDDLLDEDCLSGDFPPFWGCGEKRGIIHKTTDSEGTALVHVMLGGWVGVEYEISASYTEQNKTLEQTFIHSSYDYLVGGKSIKCEGDHDPWHGLHLFAIIPVDAQGKSIFGVAPGTSLPLTANLILQKEEEVNKQSTVSCGGQERPCNRIAGETKISFDNTYDYHKAKVLFNGIEGELETIAYDPDQGPKYGEYTHDYRVKPGINTVNIKATAQIKVKKTAINCSGLPVCSIEEEDIQKDANFSLTFYGVEIKDLLIRDRWADGNGPAPVIIVDEQGYTERDYVVSYRITPPEYHEHTSYAVILKKEGTEYEEVDYLSFGQQDNSLADKGKRMVALLRGYKFDPKASYAVEAVLNIGSTFLGGELEIRSQRLPLNIRQVKVKFLRQDNTPFPLFGDDACHMVSKLVTDDNFSPIGNFDGPPGDNPDPDTFRVEVSGLASGLTVNVKLEVLSDANDTYRELLDTAEGTLNDGSIAYRTLNIRPVSNAVDDNYENSITMLVRLGDLVRATLILNGQEVTGIQLPVGRPPYEDGPKAIRTVEVNFITLQGVNSDPQATLKRMNENWAQAAIRYTLASSSTVTPVTNILAVGGTAQNNGQLSVDITSQGGSKISVMAGVSAGDDGEKMAQKLAAAISAQPGLKAGYYRHLANVQTNAYLWLIMVNKGEEVNFSNLQCTAGSGILADATYSLNFSDGINTLEGHVLGLNFKDNDAKTVDIIAVGKVEVGGPGGRAYSGRDGSSVIASGSENTIIIREEAVSTYAGLPFVAGHEMGHVLFDTGNAGHSKEQTNLFYEGGTSIYDTISSTKRLTGDQCKKAREMSGPDTTPPLLQKK